MSTDPHAAPAPSAWAPQTSPRAAVAAQPPALARWSPPAAALSSARWRLRAEGAALVVLFGGVVEAARAVISPGPAAERGAPMAELEADGLVGAAPSPASSAAPTAQGAAAPSAPPSSPARLRHRAPSTTLVTEAGGPCAFTAKVPGGMGALTDDGLAAYGLGGRSPLILTLDGAQVPRRAPGAPCADGFSMSARALSWAGPGATAAVTLDPAFPVMTSAGPTWWVYSGSTVSFQTPLAPGDTVQIDVLGVGGKPTQRAELVVGGQRAPLELSSGRAQLSLTVTDAADSLQIEIPHGGPHLAITALHRARGGALDDLLVVR
jgi:hypothetical protein